MIKEEMEVQQPQRKRDVEAAQGRIVAVVRSLEEAGTLVVSRGDGDEEEEAVL
jgi:flagellar motor switch protein FliG